jgi:hypothetical protein
MNNLKKFASEAEYTAATLNYPAVSWVTATDNVHFDKSAPTPTVNDKVMLLTTSHDTGNDIVLYNAGSSPAEPYFISITVNDEPVPNPNSTNTLSNVGVSGEPYLIKYELTSAIIDDWFSGDLGAFGSSVQPGEVLIPSQITDVLHFPNNVYTAGAKVVCEATTPPNVSFATSGIENAILYVPDASVNAYMEEASGWASFAQILPISQYSGNLPV